MIEVHEEMNKLHSPKLKTNYISINKKVDLTNHGMPMQWNVSNKKELLLKTVDMGMNLKTFTANKRSHT